MHFASFCRLWNILVSQEFEASTASNLVPQRVSETSRENFPHYLKSAEDSQKDRGTFAGAGRGRCTPCESVAEALENRSLGRYSARETPVEGLYRRSNASQNERKQIQKDFVRMGLR